MGSKVLLAVAALTLGFASLASAADDPIAARQALMKKNGGAAKVVVDMIKGDTAYDAAGVQAAMKTLRDDMTEFVTLFPEGSDKGDTTASPKIWEDMAGFKAAADKLSAAAKATADAAPNGLEAVKAAFNDVGASCGGCHQAYRVKKN